MDPALAVNLHRALEIGRAQRGQFGVPSTETPLPLQVELLHLDQAIADSMLLQDLTWIDGEAHLVVLQRPHPARPRAGRPHRQHARGRRRHGVSVPHSVLGAPGWYELGNPRARKKKLVLKRPPPPAVDLAP